MYCEYCGRKLLYASHNGTGHWYCQIHANRDMSLK